MNNMIRSMPHVEQKPLNIEREYTMQGREIIVIEGVRYDADLLKAFGSPAPDALYAVRRDGENVWLTVIRSADEAKQFFDETLGQGASQGDTSPAPTEDESDGL